MIFRIDDVSHNTDMTVLNGIIELLTDKFCADIWLAVSLMTKKNEQGSVYPNPPFKDKALRFFLDVDQIGTPKLPEGDYKVVSHGLIHSDHSVMAIEAQEISIVTSCNILNTNIFVPPFNRYNEFTEQICSLHGIELVKMESDFESWKNFDLREFDEHSGLWYLHPWRYKTIEDFKNRFAVKNAS